MITADGNAIAARGGASNAHGDGIGLATAAGEAGHVGPGMQLDQPLGEFDFFGGIEARHIAGGDGLHHGGIDGVIAIAQRIGADAHDRHVDPFDPIKVPDAAAFGLAEIGRPLIGQEHFGALGQ
ncbi:hypothetical protein D3C86_1932940 [compost metagenome]